MKTTLLAVCIFSLATVTPMNKALLEGALFNVIIPSGTGSPSGPAASKTTIGYSGPKWAFAYNDGYNKYYGQTVFTDVIDVNQLPGAAACKNAGDFVQLTTKFIQHFYDTHYPGGQFGNSDLLPVILSPSGKYSDCWTRLEKECFYTTMEQCEQVRQKLIATLQKTPNVKLI